MSFEVSRLRRSDQMVAVGAIALFVFMFFFKWFGASVSGASPVGGSFSFSSSVNGWHSVTNTRWLLLLTIVVALGAVVLVATERELSLPLKPSTIVAGLGGLSAIFVLYRIIDHPSGGGGVAGIASYSYGAKIGLYLAFAACLILAYGGWMAMQEEGTTLGDVREQARASFDSVTSPAGASGDETSAHSEPPAQTPGEPPAATPYA
jgi:hypothetical protein